MFKFHSATKTVMVVFLVAVIAMLAMDLVVVIAQQRYMITERINTARSALPVLTYQFGHPPAQSRETLRSHVDDTLANHRIACMGMISAGSDAAPGFWGGGCRTDMTSAIAQTIGASPGTTFWGRTWGVIWLRPKLALVAARFSPPASDERQVIFAVDLVPVYHELRKSQGYLLVYMLINALVLTFLGSLRIWQASGRPIQKLAQRADAYQVTDPLLFQTSIDDGSDFARLSRSLNHMMQRIETDRKALQGTVADLEKANIELKRAQADVIRAEKLGSVGRLAAGIAHEIGNPIGIVTGYLELLKADTLTDTQRDEFIRRAEDELNRINRIIRQLLDFSRPSPEDAEAPVAIHGIIEDVAALMSAQPSMNGISLVLALEADSDHIIANAQQMRQVFLNLLLNAADAITESPDHRDPQIILRTQADRHAGAAAENGPPGTLKIEVIDNGAGIDEAHLHNVFDPFFTTKEPGKGTGLGLSVCYMIVDSIGGRITVHRRQTEGTLVSLTFPLAAPTAPEKGEPTRHVS